MILITGGKGEVGSNLAKIFEKNGSSVLLTSRKEIGSNFINWDMNKKFELGEIGTIDAIVHCAFDFTSISGEMNIVGANSVAEYATAKNIPMINISTVLAEFDKSKYGKLKKKIEKIVNRHDQFNLRIGVISSNPPISNIGRLQYLAVKLRLFLFPGLSTYVFETRLDSLAEVISVLIENKDNFKEKNFYVISPIKRKLSEVLRDSINESTRVIYLINFPISIAVWLTQLVSVFLPKFRKISDSLRGNQLLSKKNDFTLEEGWRLFD
jgi:hypothetical protein